MSTEQEDLLQEQVSQSVRAHRRRQDGVQYKLRVIEGSGGLLELVEEPPKSRHWFIEWARLMQLANWTL